MEGIVEGSSLIVAIVVGGSVALVVGGSVTFTVVGASVVVVVLEAVVGTCACGGC